MHIKIEYILQNFENKIPVTDAILRIFRLNRLQLEPSASTPPNRPPCRPVRLALGHLRMSQPSVPKPLSHGVHSKSSLLNQSPQAPPQNLPSTNPKMNESLQIHTPLPYASILLSNLSPSPNLIRTFKTLSLHQPYLLPYLLINVTF